MDKQMPRRPRDAPQDRLLSLAAQGNKQAFGKLYERYVKEIYRYIFFKVGDSLEAEDITENVFLQTWERLPELHVKGEAIKNFRAWIYRVARNLVIDFYRAQKPVYLPDEINSADEQSPEEIIHKRLLSQRLTMAIMELEPDYQQIIILRFINQLSHKEAAFVMNLSPGNTRILQYRAIKKLRLILSGKESRDV